MLIVLRKNLLLNRQYTYIKIMKKITYKIIILMLIALPFISFASHYVATSNATNITMNSAQFNGFVDPQTDYDHPIQQAKFRYTTSNPNQVGSFFSVTEVNAVVGPVGWSLQRRLTANVTGLQPGTTYYVQASVRAHNQTILGEWVPFATLLTNPNPNDPGGPNGNPNFGSDIVPATAIGSVTTDGADTITDVEATFKGSVSGIEGGTAYGYFRYSTQSTPPVFCNDIYGSNMKSVPAGATGGNNSAGVVVNGSFSAKVTDLTPSTRYYYCAIVSNSAKSPTIIKYGQVKSITTFPCQTCDQTKIITRPAIVVGSSSANLYGEYGSTQAVSTYFEHKTSELSTATWIKSPEESHTKNSYGRITTFIKGLRPNTHYVFRAVARTSDPEQTFYGDNLHFKTFSADGFGDGEGWVYDGTLPETTVVGNPTQICDQTTDYIPPGCEDTCPAGSTGTPPNCVPTPPPPLPCGIGFTGTPPNCVPANPSVCAEGYSGEYPNCILIITNSCPYGGVWPDCNTIPNTCLYGGVWPDCNNTPGTCPYGGTYPNCNAPTGTCPYGGIYPACNGQSGPDITGGNGGGYNGDLDSTGTGNTSDSDGDGLGNAFDTDDDNDGVFDANDVTPLGNGSSQNDLDGDGLSNSVDIDDDGDGIPDISDQTPFGTSFNPGDIDGDGINNSLDTDIDGDGIPNASDPDNDNDGLPDHLDKSANGIGFVAGVGTGNENNNQSGEPKIGDITTPPNDAIVRYHEGVETVFIRQILKNTTLQQKYGHKDASDLQSFGNYLAHFFGKNYGYVAKNRKEVRVRYPDVAAYELREVKGTTTVYESYLNKNTGKFEITGIRKLNSLFKLIFKYEYYFLKKR